jgi:integrase
MVCRDAANYFYAEYEGKDSAYVGRVGFYHHRKRLVRRLFAGSRCCSSTSLVFLSQWTGDPFGFTAGSMIYDKDPTRPIGDWKEAWEKAKRRTGATLSGEREEEKSEPLQCRFHDLRHTAVTRMLEAGISYPVVASIMGWSAATAIRMAKRCGHIGNQALRAAVDVLGEVRTTVGSLKKSPKSQEAENVAVQ